MCVRRRGWLARSFGGVPITALTATATDACRDDVIRVLRMGSPQVFQVRLWVVQEFFI